MSSQLDMAREIAESLQQGIAHCDRIIAARVADSATTNDEQRLWKNGAIIARQKRSRDRMALQLERELQFIRHEEGR